MRDSHLGKDKSAIRCGQEFLILKLKIKYLIISFL